MEKTDLMLHEVAELLGVSNNTLRNWDKSGKLKPKRDSGNGYRLYSYSDVKAFLEEKDEHLRLFNSEVDSPPESGASSQSKQSQSLKSLLKLLNRILRDGYGGTPLERFEEITKLLFVRLHEEKFGECLFEVIKSSKPEDLKRKVDSKYRSYLGEDSASFNESVRNIKLDPSTLFKAYAAISKVKLLDYSDDIKGSAYEEFLRDTFDKNDNQQFFTPNNLVEFMVQSLNIKPNSSVCDPACGSGGFLINSAKSKVPGLKLFGYEVDSRMAWVSFMNMKLSGANNFKIKHLTGAGSLGRELSDVKPWFDFIITNPPFGSDFSGPELGTFVCGKGRPSRRRGALFVERCISLVKEGGSIAIILDDSLLNGEANRDVRELIVATCDLLAVVSLPEEAFMPYATVKSSILFLRKRKKGQRCSNLPVLMAIVENVGRKPNGDADFIFGTNEGFATRLNSDLPALSILLRQHLSSPDRKIETGGDGPFCFIQHSSDESTFAERMDPLFYHPIRAKTLSLLKSMAVPLKSLDELVAERTIVTIPKETLVDETIVYIGLANIESNTGHYNPEIVSGEKIKSAVRLFRSGDILFSKLRPELRKSVLIGKSESEGFVSSECYVLRPKSSCSGDPELNGYATKSNSSDFVLPEYLAFVLRTDFIYGQVMYQVTGIGRPRISKSALMSLKIPVPDLKTQQEVVRIAKRANDQRVKIFQEISDLKREVNKSFEKAEAGALALIT